MTTFENRERRLDDHGGGTRLFLGVLQVVNVIAALIITSTTTMGWTSLVGAIPVHAVLSIARSASLLVAMREIEWEERQGSTPASPPLVTRTL